VNYQNPEYENHWEGNKLLFTAMGARSEHTLGSTANQRLLRYIEEGFTIVVFERYSPGIYYYRGVLEFREVIESLQVSNREKGKDFFVFQQVRRSYRERQLGRLYHTHIAITHEEYYWTQYVAHQDNEIRRLVTSKRPNPHMEYSIWRSYASRILEELSTEFEEIAPGLTIPEYELERGSIKATLAVFAAATTIVSGSVTAVARYPDAKANLPTLLADASNAFEAAVYKLHRKYPKAFIVFDSPLEKHHDVHFDFPTMAPGPGRRRIVVKGDGI
jgi:hypothetical protein